MPELPEQDCRQGQPGEVFEFLLPARRVQPVPPRRAEDIGRRAAVAADTARIARLLERRPVPEIPEHRSEAGGAAFGRFDLKHQGSAGGAREQSPQAMPQIVGGQCSVPVFDSPPFGGMARAGSRTAIRLRHGLDPARLSVSFTVDQAPGGTRRWCYRRGWHVKPIPHADRGCRACAAAQRVPLPAIRSNARMQWTRDPRSVWVTCRNRADLRRVNEA